MSTSEFNAISNPPPNRFLKQVLVVDAAVSLAGGALHVAASAAVVFQPIGNYTALGVSYLVFNSLCVLVMASLEFAGLQRRGRAVAYSI